VSQHLKILKDAGLVEDTAAGTRRIYRLNPVALAALRDQLDTYWQRALAGYARAAEAPDEEGNDPDGGSDSPQAGGGGHADRACFFGVHRPVRGLQAAGAQPAQGA